jgi:hypothetical protein
VNEYTSLTFDNFSQAQRAAQVQQSLQAELVAAHSLFEELHAHVASQRPRDQIPQKVEALTSADALVQDKLFEQATLPGTIQVVACDKLMLSTASNDNCHAQETPVLADGGKVSDAHGCMGKVSDAHGCMHAGAQYVRREVLEQVKLKAKADLAQLETELMAVIQAMEAENRGAARRGNVESPWLTPDLTSALRPQTADKSPSPGEVSEMTWATTRRTSSPPAWRELLHTQSRQRASGIAVESMRQEQKDSLEFMNAEHHVALHGMVDDGMFDWNPVSDSKHAERDRGSVAGDLERKAREAREAREAIRQDALRMWGAEIEGLRHLGWSLSQSLAFSGLLCV